MAVERDLEVQEPCPGCGKPRAEWTEGTGEGYPTEDELVFCSEQCAVRTLHQQLR